MNTFGSDGTAKTRVGPANFLVIAFVLSAGWLLTAAIQPPHNETNGISCDSCHMSFASIPSWWNEAPVDIDDEPLNRVCWQSGCHDGVARSYKKTHSSLATSDQYGNWSWLCVNCHNPHQQEQAYYDEYLPALSGIITGINPGTKTFTLGTSLPDRTGDGAPSDDYAGWSIVPNRSYKTITYKIATNTANTVTVTGAIQISRVSSGSQFGILPGRFVKRSFAVPGGQAKAVKFYSAEGQRSFAHNDGMAGGEDSTPDGVCQVCHGIRSDGEEIENSRADGSHISGHNSGTNCVTCHPHAGGFAHGGGGGTGCGTAATCHGTVKSHVTHVKPVEDGGLLGLACSECHDTNNFPTFIDGQDKAATAACDNCHTANGVALAKQYWDNPGSSARTAGSWAVVEGEKSYCGSCHDATPGKTRRDGGGDTAMNILGNDSTYGFYITGHGKTSGNYARLSHQDTSAAGNPAASLQSCTGCHSSGFVDPVFSSPCGACHELTSAHFNSLTKRIKPGMENDQMNTNCKRCHSHDASEGTAATDAPHFYTTSADYENSAHKDRLCTECHNVHGSAGAYTGMTKANREALCNNCHAGHQGHALGVQFGKDGKTYSLECTSCHNIHIVTGLTSAANPTVSAMTRFIANLSVWGDDAGEKIDAYAGSGKYATPTGDTMSGSQQPDYPTFCLDCHSTPMSEFGRHGGITWNDDNHGLVSSNVPNGGGSAPNWYSFGMANGWDGDDCTGTQAECWPVIPRGRGEQLWTRATYNQEERIAGANFVMSCNDCHVTHESGVGAKIRTTVNGAPGSTSHNTMCNACHYYYSDWHAGMSCGNAGCHNAGCWNERICQNQNSIHGIYHAAGDGSTRTWNGGLVLDMRFENNLNDSGSFRLHSKWSSTAGSFSTGKVGQAAVLGEDIGLQVGTTNSYWSTDEGNHGTWKYTEMKYNTTLEAWIYPTDNAKSEYTIFRKHTGYNDGGYGLSLKKIGGTLRAVFNMQADNNGGAQNGRAGVRGAYSSTAVPLNIWTHVAATFDRDGPDRNPSDPSVGRIRIYINGEDVTTSDPSGSNMQPGADETSIFAYSENSPWNEGICYNGTWCASEFSIGGFDWEAANFIGRIDEARVWNITKDSAYFAAYDSQAAPYISHVEGLLGNNQLTMRFSEGVYTNAGSAGALVPADFVFTDAGGNNPRTITGVAHAAGSSIAVITMSAPLTVADVNTDTLAAAAYAVYDNNNIAAGTEAVPIGLSSQCPASPVSIQLNETSGSAYVMDTQGILYGAVSGGTSALPGDGSFHGDGSGAYYVDFPYNSTCLLASSAMTLEARIRPSGLAGTGSYLRRVIERNAGNANYQLSVWRNNGAAGFSSYNAPAGEASVALWVAPSDAHGGDTWKAVLTNYSGAANGSENACPIVSDHWYYVKAVWDTNKSGGTPGQFFQPADIYIEDQGTDGSGAGRNWAGLVNCTDTDQSLKDSAKKFYKGDLINTGTGLFRIGSNVSGGNLFNGQIDWLTWKNSAD